MGQKASPTGMMASHVKKFAEIARTHTRSKAFQTKLKLDRGETSDRTEEQKKLWIARLRRNLLLSLSRII